MRRLFIFMGAAWCAAAWPQKGSLAVPDVRWLQADGKAWQVSPPRHRLASVIQAFAAPDGESVLALTLGPSARLVLLSADGVARASAPALESDLIQEVSWSEDGSIAAVRLMQGKEGRLLLISAAGRWAEAPSELQSIISGGPGVLLAVQTPPGADPKDAASGRGFVAAANSLRFVPSDAYTSYLQAGWAPVSQPEGLLYRGKEAIRLNIRTRIAAPYAPQMGVQVGWSLTLRTNEGRDKTAWLSAGQQAEPVALSRDAVWVSLAKDNSQALYISDGSLFARQIQPGSMEDFRTAQVAEARRQAEEDAAEAIRAVWAVAGKGGNQLPEGSSQALLDALDELGLADRVRFNNLGSQNIKSGESIEIGYVETPFGNLAIFINGSTEWRGR